MRAPAAAGEPPLHPPFSPSTPRNLPRPTPGGWFNKTLSVCLLLAYRLPSQYLEIDGAGHCPHHEAPRATNLAITSCLQEMERIGSAPPAAAAATTSAPASATQQGAAAGGALPAAAAFIGRDDHAHGDEVSGAAAAGVQGAEVLLPLLAVGQRFEVQEEEEVEEEVEAGGAGGAQGAGTVEGGEGGVVAASTAQAGDAAAGAAGEEGQRRVVVVRRRRQRTVVLEHVDGRPRILPERVSHFIWSWLERSSTTTAAVTSVSAAGGSS